MMDTGDSEIHVLDPFDLAVAQADMETVKNAIIRGERADHLVVDDNEAVDAIALTPTASQRSGKMAALADAMKKLEAIDFRLRNQAEAKILSPQKPPLEARMSSPPVPQPPGIDNANPSAGVLEVALAIVASDNKLNAINVRTTHDGGDIAHHFIEVTTEQGMTLTTRDISEGMIVDLVMGLLSSHIIGTYESAVRMWMRDADVSVEEALPEIRQYYRSLR